jgi:two-component system OmpR family sensor kinase
MIATLKSRIAVWYISLSTVILIGLGVALYFITSQSMMNERRALLAQDLNRMEQLSERLGSRGVGHMLEEAEEEIPLKPGDEVVEVFTLEGQSKARSSGLKTQHLPFRPDLAKSGALLFETVTLSTDGSAALLGSTSISISDQSYIVSLAISLANVRNVQRRLLFTLLLSIPIAIALALIGGVILAKRAIEPLNTMTATAHRISAEHLAERIDLERGDLELKLLADAFNQMLQRLDVSFTQIRQFTADASHELRTPVAILIGETELAVNDLLDEEECKAALVSRREELRRMAQIIDDLLTLSEFDYSKKPLKVDSLDFSDLVIEMCEQQRPLAKAKGVSLELADTVPVKIEGDASRLRQMVRNILDNAIKYTTPGGRVEIKLDQLNDQVTRLRISDTGIGIPEDAQAFVFDRFYRVDQARTRKEAGSGLGLSIVKQIVEAHHGSLSLESDLGQGTNITLILPNHSLSTQGL